MIKVSAAMIAAVAIVGLAGCSSNSNPNNIKPTGTIAVSSSTMTPAEQKAALARIPSQALRQGPSPQTN